jgi:hypothetical protein
VAYSFLFIVVAESFGYDCLPVILLIMVEGLSLTFFVFRKVYVWFNLSFGFSYSLANGANLDDFNLLKVLVISLSLPVPMILI